MRKAIWSLLLVLSAIPDGRTQALEFVENKGQWPAEVHFTGRLNTGALFLTPIGYKVLQYQADEYRHVLNDVSGHGFLHQATAVKKLAANGAQQNDVATIRSHAYHVRFGGGDPKAVAVPERRLPGYSNYYIGNDASRWASQVYGFEAVTYRQMYRGVDVRYYSDEGFVKYDLLVAPGGAVNEIVLEYDGVLSLGTEKGELVVSTSVGEVRERVPYSYQLVNGIRREVPCSYVVKGNTVRFRLVGYDAAWPLVIDPTWVFSTFAGSVPDNWGYTATFDKEGNAYGGGIVMGTGYPTTTGAFQTTFGGGTSGSEGPNGFDINILKLDPDGRRRIYSTYLGGNSNEQPHSLVVDNDGNLLVAGRTLSTNFPLAGAGQIGPGGRWDIIVTKFNAAGTALIGSVRIGGSSDDGVNVRHKFPVTSPSFTDQNYGDDARSEIIVDGAGFVYVAGCTQSGDLPVSAGALQTSLQGAQDAVLLKFTPNLSSLLFCTYLGGSGYDAAYVLTVEGGGDILVAGGTMSNNFPGDKAGTVGTNFTGGALDGFIARISGDGTTLRKAAYIGTAANDQLYGIQKDKNGFIYVMGTSTGNFPVKRPAGTATFFSQTGGKQFIAKLRPDLSEYEYATVFGPNTPNPNISPTAFLVDNCENVYVSGWGGNIIPSAAYPISPTTGLTVTNNAIQRTTDGMDFYFFVLERDALSQLYGSFFGQQAPTNPGSHDHVDGGTSRFDENGIIYQGICANCNGGQFPTTPGTISPGNPSARCNLAIVKINFNLSGVRTGIQSYIEGVRRDSSGCVPATIEFVDSIALGKRYEWDFGDGSPVLSTDTSIARHTYDREGIYRVRLIAIDDDKCIPRDTSYMNVRVRIDRVQLNATSALQPPCQELRYRFDNLTVPFPGKPFRNNSFIWLFGDNSAPLSAGANPVTHQYPGPGTYNVRLVLVDTNYCNAPDTFALTVRVSPNVTARFTSPVVGCVPFRASFTNTSLGGSSFLWDFGNGQTSTDVNPSTVFADTGWYRVKLVAYDPNTCNGEDSTFINVYVSGRPQADFVYSPDPSQENIPTTFTNLSGPARFYNWSFGDGGELLTIRRDTLVRHQYPRSGSFDACLVAINEFGCADTTCQVITATVTPAVDVVTAFTPNGDGVNDRAVVYGFGVAKMSFRIYNRWGQLMFETSDPARGWDGRFRGQHQPMDAYAFTLDAEMIDGTTVRKTGNITLIR
ncbi:MAG TPA: PKD domain-containing protein [Phnomibacter sp.]|nr:PKD domain-containing protein [Phnomibacter sp.]